MSSLGPRNCEYEITYEFTSRDDSSRAEYPVTVTADTNDRDRYEDKAYRHLMRMLGLGSVDEARREWTYHSTRIGFANPPWSDWNELEQKLKSIPGVRSLSYDPPTVNNWHPPRFLMLVHGGQAEAVRQAVSNYYDGLTPIVRNGQSVVVVVSPLE